MSIATLYGGWRGWEEAKGDKARQEQQLQDWLAEIQGIDVPGRAEQEITPEMFQQLESMQMEGLASQGDTELAGISLDPATRQAQMDALTSLRDVANSGGLSDLDKASIAQAQRQIGMQQKGARDAISQNMQSRGMAGSGMELMNKLMAQQSGAEQANMMGMQQAAQAQQARMAALQGMGSLGGNIRAQDYGIKADRAQAQDAINRFNTMNKQGQMGRNTDRTNQRGMLNNEIGNKNVAMRNAAQAHNKGLYQTEFGNKMQKGMAQGASRGALSDMYGKKAEDTQRMWAGMGASHDQQHNNRAGTLAEMFGGMFGG